MSDSQPDLELYDRKYKRRSDGRDFLCRNITPNDCRMFDTVTKQFESMSTSKRSRLYKGVGTKYYRTNKKKCRVSGAKVRDLRKAGHEVIGGKGWHYDND